MLNWFVRRLLPRSGVRAAYRFHLRYWFLPDRDLAAKVLATMRPSRALAPELSEGPQVERLALIAPHPDDEVIGPGGTLIKALRRGINPSVIFLTDGETETKIGAERREEAIRVAQRLGFSATFLGLPPNALLQNGDGAAALADVLRSTRPQAVMLPFLLDDNDDHRAANALFWQAAQLAGLKRSIEVWAYQVYSALPANVLVPLGDAAAGKAEAIRLYESQGEVRDWANYALGLNAYNTRLAPRRCRDAHVEAFFVVPLSEYLELCREWRG